jgi:hypothetical protein
MTKGTGNLGAVWTLASVSTLGFLACTSPQVAPSPSVHFPVAEQRIFVELPENSALKANELRAQYRAGRRTISHVRERCVTDPLLGPCRTTDVRISAVEGAKYIDPLEAPSRPQIIAWIENLGNTATYDGIEPRTRAVYALVVDSRPKQNARIVRVRFPADRAPEPRVVSSTDAGNVYPCHSYGQPYISDADFQSCSPYPKIGRVALHSLGAGAMFASASTVVATSPDDPTWFSCSSGCCSSAAYQLASQHTPRLFSDSRLDHLLALAPSPSH